MLLPVPLLWPPCTPVTVITVSVRQPQLTVFCILPPYFVPFPSHNKNEFAVRAINELLISELVSLKVTNVIEQPWVKHCGRPWGSGLLALQNSLPTGEPGGPARNNAKEVRKSSTLVSVWLGLGEEVTCFFNKSIY